MNIDSILVQDTNGDLAKEILKNDVNKQALSVWFSDYDKANKKILNFAVNNIRYDLIPSIEDTTYVTFLTYNGSSGYQNKMFSTIVAYDSGDFNRHEIPVLTYDPNNIQVIPELEELNDVVLDIKMYNGTIDVLNYTDYKMGHGTLSKGSNAYTVKSRRAFPTKVDILPNVENNRVFLDGWYSFTHIIYKDITEGSDLVAGNFYSFRGKLYKSLDYGKFYIGNNTTGRVVLRSGDISTTSLVEVGQANYEDLLFSLNETSAISPQANDSFLHSQVLITEELRQAILQEIVKVACSKKIGCDFMDWQNLTLKRIAAYVMFENGLFEKAQLILEAARAMCTGGNGFDLNCY